MNRSSGLWTICIHTNTTPAVLEEKLDNFLQKSAQHFVSFDQVLKNRAPSGLNWAERSSEWIAIQRIRLKSLRREIRRPEAE